jgi:hypothetical protein
VDEVRRLESHWYSVTLAMNGGNCAVRLDRVNYLM